MNEFDITTTYAEGDHVIYENKEYVWQPKNWRMSFSIGLLPIYGFGWKPKATVAQDICDSLKLCNEMFKDYDSALASMLNKNRERICKYVLLSIDQELYFNYHPNEPTVLDCKDKMINEI